MNVISQKTRLNSINYKNILPRTYTAQHKLTLFKLPQMKFSERKQKISHNEIYSKNTNKNINIDDTSSNIGKKTFNFNDIIFTSEFNSGNMKQCTKLSDNEYSILIASDCEGKILQKNISNFKIWFYFGVKSSKEKKIRISIDNLNNFTKIFRNGYKIVYNELDYDITPEQYQNSYHESEEYNWKRLNMDYMINLDEKTNLLSIKFDYFFPENRYVLFAFCFPWSYEKNEAYLNFIKKNYSDNYNNTNIYYHDEILILSKEKRKVHLLTITSKNNVDFSKKELNFAGMFPDKNRCNLTLHDKHIIFITARVHPGETPGTFIFNGILKSLLDSDNPINKILLDNFIFKLVPMINVDGVSNGYFRLEQDGYNLNRCYLNPDQKKNPENFAITKMFFFYSAKNKVRYYFDLHADMQTHGVYTFGNALKSFEEHVENVLFSFIFKINCPNVDFSHCIFTERCMGTKTKNELTGKEATSRVQFYQKTGLIHTYTVESSYIKGVFNKDNIESEKSTLYEVSDFENIGLDLLKGILDYEQLLLSDNLLRSEYQTLERCRVHIAQKVKFNEERFRYIYSLRDFINNIEEQRKWMSVKEINEMRNKIMIKNELNQKMRNKKTHTTNKIKRGKNIMSKNNSTFLDDSKFSQKTNFNTFRNKKEILSSMVRKKTSEKPFHVVDKELNLKLLNKKMLKKHLNPIKNE